eukprot:CAMPEP_0171408120 /NCGR_PEP_ID=MMETSP0880-20121228/21406_1 /TAXON_ID=67004 /ORGANISM="Thalassiosira weissflogii, Strain CCMP1336" /LENGTH=67 /DNA_ID=CAMNT_0011924263 /DNA_START=177 /DNA_END=377 /DNA_ORIENTATION=+
MILALAAFLAPAVESLFDLLPATCFWSFSTNNATGSSGTNNTFDAFFIEAVFFLFGFVLFSAAAVEA